MKILLIVFTVLTISCNSKSQTQDNEKINKLMKLANVSDSLHDLKNSIRIYSDILKIDSTKLVALTNRGRALIWNGQFNQGLADLDKVIQLYPSEKTFCRRGMAYLFMNNYDKASLDFQKSLQLSKTFTEAYYGLSLIKLNQEKLDSALIICQNADNIAYLPEFSNEIKSQVFKKKGDYKSYINILDTIVALLPKNANSYNNRGLAKNELKLYKEAIKDFDTAIELDSNMAFAYNNKAYSLYKINELKDAFENVNQSIKIDDKNSYAFKNRGLFYLAQNEEAKACVDFDIAEKLNLDTKFKDELKVLINKYCKK